jgi:nitroreductase
MHCIACVQRSPSGFNAQPYVMVVVQGDEARAALAAAMIGGANAARVLAAAFTVVFAADLQAARTVGALQALERGAGKGARYLRSLETDLTVFSSVTGSPVEHAVKAAVLCAGQFTGSPLPTVNHSESWAFKSTALAAQTLMLGATAHGLGTCAMEGLNADKVRHALAIPERYGIPMVVAVGFSADDYEGSPATTSPRYELRQVARLDRFDCELQAAGNIALGDKPTG